MAVSSNPVAVTLLCICTKYLRRALKLGKMSKYQNLKEAEVSYKQKFIFVGAIGQNKYSTRTK